METCINGHIQYLPPFLFYCALNRDATSCTFLQYRGDEVVCEGGTYPESDFWHTVRIESAPNSIISMTNTEDQNKRITYKETCTESEVFIMYNLCANYAMNFGFPKYILFPQHLLPANRMTKLINLLRSYGITHRNANPRNNSGFTHRCTWDFSDHAPSSPLNLFEIEQNANPYPCNMNSFVFPAGLDGFPIMPGDTPQSRTNEFQVKEDTPPLENEEGFPLRTEPAIPTDLEDLVLDDF